MIRLGRPICIHMANYENRKGKIRLRVCKNDAYTERTEGSPPTDRNSELMADSDADSDMPSLMGRGDIQELVNGRPILLSSGIAIFENQQNFRIIYISAIWPLVLRGRFGLATIARFTDIALASKPKDVGAKDVETSHPNSKEKKGTSGQPARPTENQDHMDLVTSRWPIEESQGEPPTAAKKKVLPARRRTPVRILTRRRMGRGVRGAEIWEWPLATIRPDPFLFQCLISRRQCTGKRRYEIYWAISPPMYLWTYRAPRWALLTMRRSYRLTSEKRRRAIPRIDRV